MTALYILGGLAALIVVLLMGDITLRVGYDGEFTLCVGYLFLHFRVLPAKPKKQKKPKKKKAAEPPSAEPKPKTKPDLSFDDILAALGMLLRTLGKIAGKTRVRPCRLWISVASGDAAATALTYGKVCAGLGALNSLLKELLGSVKSDFRVGWDYTRDKIEVRANIVIRIRLLWIVKNGISLIWHLLIGSEAPLNGLIQPKSEE